jgi:hypothetical protein
MKSSGQSKKNISIEVALGSQTKDWIPDFAYRSSCIYILFGLLL